MVVSLTTALVVLINGADSGYTQSMQELWVAALYPAGFDTLVGNPLSFPGDQFYIQRGGQLVESIESVVLGAFQVQNSSLDFIRGTPGVPTVSLTAPGSPPVDFISQDDFQAWSRTHLPSAANCSMVAGTRGDALESGAGTMDRAPPLLAAAVPASNGHISAAVPASNGHICAARYWLQGASQLSATVRLRAFNPQRVLVTSAACTDWSIAIEWELSSPGTARVQVRPASKPCRDFALTHAPASFLAVALILTVAVYQAMLCGSGLRQWGVVRDILLLRRMARAVPQDALRRIRHQLQRHPANINEALPVSCASSAAPQSAAVAAVLLAARQVSPFPPPCCAEGIRGGAAGQQVPAHASVCYGAVLCCPNRRGGYSSPPPSACARKLWSCGPGAWWATRCCSAQSGACAHRQDLVRAHVPQLGVATSPVCAQSEEGVQMAGGGGGACCEGGEQEGLVSRAERAQHTMLAEGVTIGGQYSVLELVWESASFGWQWLRPAPAPRTAAKHSGAGHETELLAEEGRDLDHVGDGEAVVCHACCCECVRHKATPAPSTPQRKQLQAVVMHFTDAALGATGKQSPMLASLVKLLTSPHLRDELQVHDMGELLSPWTFLSSLANACTACYCGIVLTHGEVAVSHATSLAFACAAFLQWLTLVQYLRHHAHLYIVMRTLARGTPALLQFLLGVVPIFIASTVFACSMFGVNTIRFDGLVRSAITLFAVSSAASEYHASKLRCTPSSQVLNGDVVRETFQVTLANEYTWFTQVVVQAFLYFFISMFIYVGKPCAVRILCLASGP